MAARPKKQEDANALQRREAQNVLDSYTKAVDLLSEALQNATDAIDTRRFRDGLAAPARILITFNVAERRFSVADSGTGMSRSELELVITPNVTMKEGPLARSTTGRSRGYKGVGLSFLALACNYLEIRTCDGEHRYDVVISNGNDWVVGESKVEKPMGQGATNAPDEYLDSERYTVVTVGDINFERFNEDLFRYDVDELIWVLRTQTAIGNTAPLFRDPFGHQPEEENFDVELEYVDGAGKRPPRRPIEYSYATPEELVPASVVIPFAKLQTLKPDEVEREARGKAVRYVKRFHSKGGRPVDFYAFIMDAREMAQYADEAAAKGAFFPDEWQGFFVATRDMPTGIPFAPGAIQPRTLERRIFALLQDDKLNLDLGRKTLAGRTLGMLRDVVGQAWLPNLKRVVERVGQLPRLDVDEAALIAAITYARKRPDLGAPLPYLKEPRERMAVFSIFHELIASATHLLPQLRPLDTAVFRKDTDSLVYAGEPNGNEPVHVLFGYSLDDILRELEREDGSGRTARLAVVWDVEPAPQVAVGVETRPVDHDGDGATHELLLHGWASLPSIRLIALKSVLESRD